MDGKVAHLLHCRIDHLDHLDHLDPNPRSVYECPRMLTAVCGCLWLPVGVNVPRIGQNMSQSLMKSSRADTRVIYIIYTDGLRRIFRVGYFAP